MTERNPFAAPPRVRRLQIEITTGCNLRCAGCQRTLGLADGTWHSAQIPLPRFAAILRHAPPADALILQGIGEPTLHPALPDMIALGRQDGRFGVISFNTNALLRDLSYYQALRQAGLGHISISVDSLEPETAAALREGTDTVRLAAMVRGLTALFGPSVTLSIVLSRRNLPELEALLIRLHGLGARVVEVQPLVSYAAATDPLALTEADRQAALAVIGRMRTRLPTLSVLSAAALAPNGSRCRRPFHALYVTQAGFLTPCCLTNDAGLMGQTSLAETPFTDAWHSPGVSTFMARYFDAEPGFCAGCAFNPAGPATLTRAPALLAQAMAQLRDGRPAQARAGFRTVATDRTVVEAVHGLGLSHLLAGEAAAAVPLLRAAQALAPEPRITHNLAMALDKTGDRAAAIALERANIADHPAYLPSWHGLSAALDAAGDRSGAAGVALALLERAIAAGDTEVIAAASARAAKLDPLHPALPHAANRLRIAGHAEAARRLLDARLAQDPGDLGARLSRVMTCLTVVHRSEAELMERRAAYLQELAALDAMVRAADARRCAQGAVQVGAAKPFHLPYHGADDTGAQRLYGQIISRLITAADTASPVAPPPPPPRTDARIRVGFATAYFHLHSVSKLFGGWLRHLDRTRFALTGYHLGEAEDGMSADLATHCAAFHRGPRGDADWMRTILADRLDVLIYPELGMHPTAVRLACRRLAPVQCVAWGHPVTSGLPTIDHFLSSALMEPEDGDRHYTEQLVRLPNLAIRYVPPPSDTGTLTRAALGLAEEAVVYLCAQSLFKYHPGDDGLYAAIAARVPAAQFVFLGAADTDPNARLLRDRLGRAFADAGVAGADRLRFVPPVPASEFPALLRIADVALDTPRWSGGNTTLEAIAAGLPIVTLPGTMMRGRHTAAILTRAGAMAWIAGTPDHYVALATGLADPARRAEAREAIRRGRAAVFDDPAPIAALERFLSDAVADSGRRAA